MQNSKTKKLIDSFINQPSSSIIIEGSEALGSEEVLQRIYSDLLGNSHKGNKIVIDPGEDNSTGIEIVRELKSKMATISGKSQEITRIACIKQSEKLTIEAQNALLKLIEEPTRNTLLVIQCDDTSALLGTIQSRCQIVKVLPITRDQAVSYIKENDLDEAALNKAYLLSGGASRLFIDLVSDKDTELTQNIKTGKEFLSQVQFERLKRQKQFDKPDALKKLLESLRIISEAGLHSSSVNTTKKWQQIIKELRRCSELLQKNVNTKLVFLRLCVMV